jgi:hypothetical protein
MILSSLKVLNVLPNKTHAMASKMLDLPLPLAPLIRYNPLSLKLNVTSLNDKKFCIFID